MGWPCKNFDEKPYRTFFFFLRFKWMRFITLSLFAWPVDLLGGTLHRSCSCCFVSPDSHQSHAFQEQGLRFFPPWMSNYLCFFFFSFFYFVVYFQSHSFHVFGVEMLIMCVNYILSWWQLLMENSLIFYATFPQFVSCVTKGACPFKRRECHLWKLWSGF